MFVIVYKRERKSRDILTWEVTPHLAAGFVDFLGGRSRA
jgi:hypothetical protein